MLLYISLITSALTALTFAFPHPAPAQLAQRDFASCQQDSLVACCLYASPSLASPYCASVLATSTVTAPTVTPFTNVTSTVFVTVSTTDTIPQTTTSTTVITATGTVTITVVSTTAITTTTTTTSVDTTLATIAPRDAAPSPPPCVTQGTYPASRISFACSCIYTQPTITVTPSAAATTITLLSTSSPVVTVTVTYTTTVPLTITTTSSFTSSTTTTRSVTAVSTSTATIAYNLAVGPTTGKLCSYTNFYQAYYYMGSPGVNFINAEDDCRNSCANDPTCEFFFVTSSTGNLAPYPVCDLSNAPYNTQYLSCLGVVDDTSYYVGYNEVIS